MGIFSRLVGKKREGVIDKVDFTKMLKVVAAFGGVLEQGKSPIRPMHELPYSRLTIRRALAFCTSGGKVPRDTARVAYTSTEGFWPSSFAYPFLDLHTRVTEEGAEALTAAEIGIYVKTVQTVNEAEIERAREFDLLVKWYEGLVVHLRKEDRRLEPREAHELKSHLEQSIAKDAEWLMEATDGLRDGSGSINVSEGVAAEQVVKELNFVHKDLQMVDRVLKEIS